MTKLYVCSNTLCDRELSIKSQCLNRITVTDVRELSVVSWGAIKRLSCVYRIGRRYLEILRFFVVDRIAACGLQQSAFAEFPVQLLLVLLTLSLCRLA